MRSQAYLTPRKPHIIWLKRPSYLSKPLTVATIEWAHRWHLSSKFKRVRHRSSCSDFRTETQKFGKPREREHGTAARQRQTLSTESPSREVGSLSSCLSWVDSEQGVRRTHDRCCGLPSCAC